MSNKKWIAFCILALILLIFSIITLYDITDNASQKVLITTQNSNQVKIENDSNDDILITGVVSITNQDNENILDKKVNILVRANSTIVREFDSQLAPHRIIFSTSEVNYTKDIISLPKEVL